MVGAALERDFRTRHLRRERSGGSAIFECPGAMMTLLYYSGLSKPGLDCHLARRPLTGGLVVLTGIPHGPGKRE